MIQITLQGQRERCDVENGRFSWSLQSFEGTEYEESNEYMEINDNNRRRKIPISITAFGNNNKLILFNFNKIHENDLYLLFFLFKYDISHGNNNSSQAKVSVTRN